MKIEKVKKYDTDIGFLFSRKTDKTIFVSDWENASEDLFLSEDALDDIARDHSLCNRYIYSRDLVQLKENICNYISESGTEKIQKENIMISSTATISGMLISKFIKKKNVKNVLVIGPIYFTYIHLFYENEIQLYNLQIDLFDEIQLPEDVIREMIEEKEIDACLIISPLYRTGIELSIEVIDMICKIMEQKGGYVIIDEAYGNFPWNRKRNYLCNVGLINTIIKYPHAIMFDSIAKRVFANGMKSSIIYSQNEEIIKEIEKDSVIWVGSFSNIQINFLQWIFSTGKNNVIDIMDRSSVVVKSNYQYYKQILEMDSNLQIVEANSSYFALVSMDRSKFRNKTEEEIVIELIEKYNVMMVPYSRYNYTNDNYLYFSINLLMKREDVEKALRMISKMISEC